MSVELEARLDEALKRLHSGSLAVLPALESLLDTSYVAAARDRAHLLRLQYVLSREPRPHSAVTAWLGLVDQALGAAEAEVKPAGAVDTPPWTRLLVTTEAARLVWSASGATEAWRHLASLGPMTTFRELFPINGARRDSPLFVSSVCTMLDLAALNGAWGVHEQIVEAVSDLWRATPSIHVRVALTIADGAMLRGRYAESLRAARAAIPVASGDLSFHARAVELHALVALGRTGLPDAEAALAACEAAGRKPSSSEWALPPEDRRRLDVRVGRLKATFPEASREHAGVADESDAPDVARRLSRLFEDEQRARTRNQVAKRVSALLPVLREAESLLGEPEVWADRATSIRLRLLWCRVVVDLGQSEAFSECERVLDEVVRDSHALGMAPLEMLGLEQRSVLHAAMGPERWTDAALDASNASRVALKLLDANADGKSDGARFERSLMESLLPVFDRAIQNHADGAMRIAIAHPEVLERPVSTLDEHVWEQDSVEGSWLRFGRLLQGYSEREQALALAEARRAWTDPHARPGRFPAELEGSPLVLDSLRSELPPTDAVLQYLLVGPYVVAFLYGRTFFDWSIRHTGQASSAERAIEELVRSLRAWTQGGNDAGEAEALARLQELLLPRKLYASLSASHVRHLRVVPHGALYRIPFGRLTAGGGALVERFSLSLHPTGRLAVESAGAAPAVLPRPCGLGYVAGPDVDEEEEAGVPRPVACARDEERALRRGIGVVTRFAELTHIDAARLSLDDVIGEIASVPLLHFTCHGAEGGLGQEPHMRLGRAPGSGLDSRSIASLQLRDCALVFLQSCSTGWMHHRRAHPVQGIPQAFLDAGARAVIAPLTTVPMALAPSFSDVFYRALRFLPAEAALRRALDVMRVRGALIVADNREAREELAARGGTMDAFEYRYMGATGVVVGGRLSRWVGRLAFAWFEWTLSRRARRRERGGEPCSTPLS